MRRFSAGRDARRHGRQVACRHRSSFRGCSQPRRKIPKMKLPVYFMRPVGELYGVLIEKGPGLRFVTVEVTERGRMLQGERQRFERAVKADESNRARQVPGGAQDRERVRRRAQANIPDHKFPGMLLEALTESELLDVQGLRLGDGADDRVIGFSVRERVEAVGAVGELHQLVTFPSGWPSHSCAIALSSAA